MAFKVTLAVGSRGRSELGEYLLELDERALTSKYEKVLLKKINYFISLIEVYGTHIGEPQVKHLEGDLWELRPNNVRILFAVEGDTIILLNHFVKKTRKTPPAEIEKGNRLLNKWRKEHL